MSPGEAIGRRARLLTFGDDLGSQPACSVALRASLHEVPQAENEAA